MRLVTARCSVDYVGRLTAHLPSARRLIVVKVDGSVSVHSDDYVCGRALIGDGRRRDAAGYPGRKPGQSRRHLAVYPDMLPRFQ